MESEAKPYHARSAAEVLAALGADEERGLSQAEAARRRRRYGPNRLRRARGRSALRILVDQFKGVVLWVLLVAGALAVLAAQWPEAVAIAAVLVVNTAIGFVSEWRAHRSMEALRALTGPEATVLRGGRERRVPAERLVPGDVLRVEAGEVLPADLRVVRAEGLRVSEAALTGESVAVAKGPEAVAEDAPLPERSSVLFRGTTVVEGEGRAVVFATGADTEMGRIAELTEEAEAEATPLERRLDRLGRRLAVATLIVAAVVGAAGLAAGQPTLLMLETAVALGVAAIPEGLPIVATLALARGMWLMARRNAVVNRLSAVETLGATRIILTDKTGTLTESRMSARRLETAAGGFDLGTAGEAERGGAPAPPLVRRALEIGALCSDASLGDASAEEGEGEGPRGDPTEVALLRAAAAHGIERPALLRERPELRSVPFEPRSMRMATFHEWKDGTVYVAVKGAPAAVLADCDRLASAEGEGEAPLDDAGRARWRERAEALAAEGLRVLALADRRADSPSAEPYRELRLVGLVGLVDPPRAGVREAIAECRRAGIRVVVVTGDQPETAGAVAREVGLGDGELRVLHGRDLPAGDALDESARRRIRETDVFARLGPEHKLDLVRVFQEGGEVVAMTGDGVNDTPALKKADIGIAMGRRGTDAAREVSDMVLRDDAFSSIVAAVEQGRVIFENIRKSVLFMLCTNAAEVAAVGAASLAGLPLPLRPLQILYLNVVTDVFPALALGVGRGTGEAMERPPRDPSEQILERRHWLAIAGWAVVIAACVLTGLEVARRVLGLPVLAAVTVSFGTLALAKLWFVLNLRDPGTSLLRNAVVRNPWVGGAVALCLPLLAAAVYLPGLADVLETRSPGPRGYALALGLSLLPLLVGQTIRALQRRSGARRPL